MKKAFLLLLPVLLLTGCRSYAVRDGQNPAVIVPNKTASPTDKFAARELQLFLSRSTGQKFQILSADQKLPAGPKIYLGKQAQLPELSTGTYMIKADGKNIYLYGGGRRGTLSAVYRFLKDQAGIRFLNAYGDNHVPARRTIAFSGEKIYSEGLPYRALMTFFHTNQPVADPFYFRNGQNFMHNSKQYAFLNEAVGLGKGHHSLHKYMPPKKYFKTHPEFYSMDRKGKRTLDQMCFAGKEVRRIFIENVIRQSKKRYEKEISPGRIAWIEISAMDAPGRFCECPDCRKAAEKYQTPCGTFWEFLIELANAVRKEMPQAKVATLLYRKDQTEKPPVDLKFPENLVGIFAPIDDNIFAPMDDRNNLETLAHLKEWCKILKHIWVWYYPVTYGMDTMPYSALRRSIRDFKLMKEAGITGTFYEHDVTPVNCLNFGELESYVLLHLFAGTEKAPEELINEFLELYYGPAAAMVKKYFNELEDHREKAVQKGIIGHFAASPFLLGHLTPENLERWTRDFDKMEKLVKDDPKRLFRLRLLRFTVDKTRIDLMTCPASERKEIIRELRATLDQLTRERRKYRSVNKRYYDELQKALRNTGSSRIEIHGSGSHTKWAAFPYHLNCYDYRTIVASNKIRSPKRWDFITNIEYSKGIKCVAPLTAQWKLISRRTLQAKDVRPDVFALYEIGTFPLTNAAKICTTDYDFFFKDIGRFYRDPDSLWRVSIKLKFEGPFVPGSKAKENKVSCGGFLLEKIK